MQDFKPIFGKDMFQVDILLITHLNDRAQCGRKNTWQIPSYFCRIIATQVLLYCRSDTFLGLRCLISISQKSLFNLCGLIFPSYAFSKYTRTFTLKLWLVKNTLSSTELDSLGPLREEFYQLPVGIIFICEVFFLEAFCFQPFFTAAQLFVTCKELAHRSQAQVNRLLSLISL